MYLSNIRQCKPNQCINHCHSIHRAALLQFFQPLLFPALPEIKYVENKLSSRHKFLDCKFKCI